MAGVPAGLCGSQLEYTTSPVGEQMTALCGSSAAGPLTLWLLEVHSCTIAPNRQRPILLRS